MKGRSCRVIDGQCTVGPNIPTPQRSPHASTAFLSAPTCLTTNLSHRMAPSPEPTSPPLPSPLPVARRVGQLFPLHPSTLHRHPFRHLRAVADRCLDRPLKSGPSQLYLHHPLADPLAPPHKPSPSTRRTRSKAPTPLERAWSRMSEEALLLRRIGWTMQVYEQRIG